MKEETLKQLIREIEVMNNRLAVISLKLERVESSLYSVATAVDSIQLDERTCNVIYSLSLNVEQLHHAINSKS